ERASAVSRKVLLGIVPVLIPAPPSSRSFSTSATRLPKSPAVFAPQMPTGPPPITTRSKSLIMHTRHAGTHSRLHYRYFYFRDAVPSDNCRRAGSESRDQMRGLARFDDLLQNRQPFRLHRARRMTDIDGNRKRACADKQRIGRHGAGLFEN